MRVNNSQPMGHCLQTILWWGLLFTSTSIAAAQTKIELQKKLSISIPATFYALTAAEIDQAHPQPTSPFAVYVHQQNREARWVFTRKPSRWQPEDMTLMRAFMQTGIANLYQGHVQWLENKTKNIPSASLQLALLSFISTLQTEDDLALRSQTKREYHLLVSCIQNGEQLLLHFSCPLQLRAYFEPQCRDALSTLKPR